MRLWNALLPINLILPINEYHLKVHTVSRGEYLPSYHSPSWRVITISNQVVWATIEVLNRTRESLRLCRTYATNKPLRLFLACNKQVNRFMGPSNDISSLAYYIEHQCDVCVSSQQSTHLNMPKWNEYIPRSSRAGTSSMKAKQARS